MISFSRSSKAESNSAVSVDPDSVPKCVPVEPRIPPRSQGIRKPEDVRSKGQDASARLPTRPLQQATISSMLSQKTLLQSLPQGGRMTSADTMGAGISMPSTSGRTKDEERGNEWEWKKGPENGAEKGAAPFTNLLGKSYLAGSTLAGSGNNGRLKHLQESLTLSDSDGTGSRTEMREREADGSNGRERESVFGMNGAWGRKGKKRVRNLSEYERKQRWRRSKSRRGSEEEEDDFDDIDESLASFRTANEEWRTRASKMGEAVPVQRTQPSLADTGGGRSVGNGSLLNTGGGMARTLGVRRGVRGNFVPPVKMGGTGGGSAARGGGGGGVAAMHSSGEDNAIQRCLEQLAGPDGELPDRLRNLEPKLLEQIMNEIMDHNPNVKWDDIAGLEHAKKCVTEMVIWPLQRPDIFQGCRSPGKGLLLFGPPGTGKTMIGKAIAGEANATFFSISASSLTSKWIGEGEKLVRALFGVASCKQPAVIFIDEIDSLLSQRKSDGEHESSRRMKTQFLVEMEGCGNGKDERILVIGATNRPQELDEAARRRMSKRLYIPLPSPGARAWIVRNLLQKDGLFTLSETEMDTICIQTEGYSGSDVTNLVKEASMGPLREAMMSGIDITKITKDEFRPISLQDFQRALQQVRASVSASELGLYEDWNRQFGSLAV
ncbi:hypothetical protein CBR_g26520 [Chara braunii]|uniref:AAA+ ATPase domain-containing protein n=1 Tax=Chara braunii TaxID=69332 RepID=A0A388L8D3_CHABU|nr:hypothetical protein CBR_g26520 [Chara braunii]|eukprot:GBG78492.1 hypothetical protein CBR_g26520 [Chara braunii]